MQQVLLYALLVLLELNGSPRKIDAFTSTVMFLSLLDLNSPNHIQ
jgi:hypothetical protein